MAKRLRLKEVRKLPKTLDGVTLTIGRTMRTPSGKTLNIGDPVPDEILRSGSIRAMIHRGYINTSKPVDIRFLDALPAERAKPEPEPEKKTFSNIGPESSKKELKEALEAMGHVIPQGAKKADLVEIYTSTLG
jgi:hypothetical protein